MIYYYTCPICKVLQTITAGTRPILQPGCSTSKCFGRLIYEYSAPEPPGAPPVLTNEQIQQATRTLVYTTNGTFCEYRLEQNRKDWSIKFRGSIHGGKEFALDLEAAREVTGKGELKQDYELPAWNGGAETRTSEIYVKNAHGSIDWVPGPTKLPKYQGPPPKRDVISFGHEANIFIQSPIRIQLGRQDQNNQHSGSGLIHLMFSHNRQSLQAVQDLVNGLLLHPSKIKGVYRSQQLEFGHYRFFIVGEGNLPHVFVLEGREGYLRLITLYKLNQSIKDHNKFKKENVRLYSANKDVY